MAAYHGVEALLFVVLAAPSHGLLSNIFPPRGCKAGTHPNYILLGFSHQRPLNSTPGWEGKKLAQVGNLAYVAHILKVDNRNLQTKAQGDPESSDKGLWVENGLN